MEATTMERGLLMLSPPLMPGRALVVWRIRVCLATLWCVLLWQVSGDKFILTDIMSWTDMTLIETNSSTTKFSSLDTFNWFIVLIGTRNLMLNAQTHNRECHVPLYFYMLV